MKALRRYINNKIAEDFFFREFFCFHLYFLLFIVLVFFALCGSGNFTIPQNRNLQIFYIHMVGVDILIGMRG